MFQIIHARLTLLLLDFVCLISLVYIILFKSAQAEALAHMLETNTTITYLGVSWNSFRERGSMALAVALGAGTNHSLQYLESACMWHCTIDQWCENCNIVLCLVVMH